MAITTSQRRRPITAIRAAALFDGTGAPPRPEPLVLVEGGRIAAVRYGPRAVAPPDAELVDLAAATLLPGLIDTHVHLAFDASPDPVGSLAGRDDQAARAAMAAAAAAHLRAGVTTVRDLGDRNYLALELRGRPSGSLPRILAAGPPITTDAGHCHFLGGAAEGIDGVRRAVREHAERGVDVIKVMASGGEMTPGTCVYRPQYASEELLALVDEAHRCGLPVTAHAHSTRAVGDALAAGLDGLEHCSFRTADGVNAPDELIEAIVAQRVAVGATLGWLPGFTPPPQLVAFVPMFVANLARMRAEGAVLVVGTDAGIAPPKPHGVLPYAVEQLVEIGMSAAEALRAITSVAAGVCGLGDRTGRVAAGFDADLLAVDGDPLTDISALHRPVAVLAQGEWATRIPEPAR